MIKVNRTASAPASLAAKRSYREKDVIDQLMEDFNGKCYLCELKPLADLNVEHLRPHHGDEALKFGWHNLFLSCPNCNSIKTSHIYDDSILDCCQTDPEAVLEQTLVDGHVKVIPHRPDKETVMTAQLLTECFEKKNTGIRVYTCQVRVDLLSETMTLLYATLKEYSKSQKNSDLCKLRGMLSRSYRFSGFTRTYVRKHLTDYPALTAYV